MDKFCCRQMQDILGLKMVSGDVSISGVFESTGGEKIMH